MLNWFQFTNFCRCDWTADKGKSFSDKEDVCSHILQLSHKNEVRISISLASSHKALENQGQQIHYY